MIDKEKYGGLEGAKIEPLGEQVKCETPYIHATHDFFYKFWGSLLPNQIKPCNSLGGTGYTSVNKRPHVN